ncbi:hypothetical protein D9M68_634610 [compost metagenome]
MARRAHDPGKLATGAGRAGAADGQEAARGLQGHQRVLGVQWGHERDRPAGAGQTHTGQPLGHPASVQERRCSRRAGACGGSGAGFLPGALGPGWCRDRFRPQRSTEFLAREHVVVQHGRSRRNPHDDRCVAAGPCPHACARGDGPAQAHVDGQGGGRLRGHATGAPVPGASAGNAATAADDQHQCRLVERGGRWRRRGLYGRHACGAGRQGAAPAHDRAQGGGFHANRKGHHRGGGPDVPEHPGRGAHSAERAGLVCTAADPGVARGAGRTRIFQRPAAPRPAPDRPHGLLCAGL